MASGGGGAKLYDDAQSALRRRSLMVELQLPKLLARVRFPSSAPFIYPAQTGVYFTPVHVSTVASMLQSIRKGVPVSAPIFTPRTTSELKKEREQLLQDLSPRTIDELRALRAIDEISIADEEILTRFEALAYVIGD